jgi:hypothetical protein
MMEVSKAREAPANMAAMPTKAARLRVMPEPGHKSTSTPPSSAPMAAPMVSSGASVPPEVPLPRARAQEVNLSRHSERMSCMGRRPERRWVMFS